MTNNNMVIGKRIRERRIELGISQAELAKKIGVKHQTSISKIEVDGRGVPLKYLRTIADFLETTPEYLLGQTDEPDLYAVNTASYNKKLEVFNELSTPNQQLALSYINYLYYMQEGESYGKKEE